LKALFTFIFIAFFSLVSAAQQPDAAQAVKKFERIRTAGIKGGVNLASVSNLIGSDMYLGAHGGFFGEVQESESVGFGGEILYSSQGVMVDNIDFSFKYLSLPVFLNFHSGKATFQGGGYGAFLLNASVRQFQDKQNITGYLSDTDLGLFIGLRLKTSGKLALGARYYMGLQNINEGLVKPYDAEVYNRNMQLSIMLQL
jgi:hypothetical protein